LPFAPYPWIVRSRPCRQAILSPELQAARIFHAPFEKVKGPVKKWTVIVCWLLGALLGGEAAGNAATAVDLELVLAVDVSDSIDPAEARLQREGYVAALTDPAVLDAIRRGPLGRIALTYAEYAGNGHYRVVVGWAAIDGADSARAFAARLAAAALDTRPRTSISDAIMLSLSRFDDNGFEGARRIIDISGDGPNNSGAPVVAARDAAVTAGVTVNGLPILPQPGEIVTHGAIRDLDLYYQDCVIGGPGAFIVLAQGYETFAEAILRKLIREIAAVPAHRPALRRVAADAGSNRPPCNIGEWLWFSAPLVGPDR
jgi:hypothetical protein